MKNALISPEEKVTSPSGEVIGERIADVSATAFEVAPPLFWVPCADDVIADLWYWDGANCVIIPPPSPPVVIDQYVTSADQVGPNVIA